MCLMPTQHRRFKQFYSQLAGQTCAGAVLTFNFMLPIKLALNCVAGQGNKPYPQIQDY